MARVGGRLIVKVARWRIVLVQTAVQPVALAYAFGVISEGRVDRIVAAWAHWACKGAVVARVEWE